MKKIFLIFFIAAIFKPLTMDAGVVSTDNFYSYGRASVSGIPGFYGDFQLYVGTDLHFGSGFGYKPVARELYNTGATTVVFDAYIMYQFYEIKGKDIRVNFGLLGGMFIDDARTGGQGGITSEIFYKETVSLRLNPVFGPRAGIEFVYHYDYELNFTVGISGISGLIGVELIFKEVT